ncbi:MAG TPA: GYF domain-containing protein [Xanthobacteraceae bacterium]|nr:GYF domain-containing protein [Xanthobacteraceae bacterium]
MQDEQRGHHAASAVRRNSGRPATPALAASRVRRRWYANVDGQNYGPFESHDIERMVQDGRILDTDYLWEEGGSSWTEARNEAAFRAMFQSRMPSLPQSETLNLGKIIPDKDTEHWGIIPEQEAASEQDDLTRDLREFFGPRAETYLAIHARMRSGTNAFAGGWNWPVFFIGFPWFFYRKMYVIGAIVLIAPALAAYLIGFTGNAGISAVLATLANRIYISIAMRRLKKADTLALVGEERRDYLRRAGGVSVVAGTLAGLVLAASFASIIFAEYLKYQKSH